jgi:hypothetical protein
VPKARLPTHHIDIVEAQLGTSQSIPAIFRGQNLRKANPTAVSFGTASHRSF